MRRLAAALLRNGSSAFIWSARALLTATVALLVPATCAAAVPECQARVQVPVTDDMGHLWHAGFTVPVDIARDDTNGRHFCAHCGACLPRRANGEVALKLINCRVGPSIGNGDYRLVPDARLAGAADADAMARRSDVEEQLSKLGFSNAAAGSLADEYVNHPRSVTARKVRRALAGSPRALKALQVQFP